MIDPKHIEFFNELKELLSKYEAAISWNERVLQIAFRKDAGIYQTGTILCTNPLESGLGDTFHCIELVTTERVFK